MLSLASPARGDVTVTDKLTGISVTLPEGWSVSGSTVVVARSEDGAVEIAIVPFKDALFYQVQGEPEKYFAPILKGAKVTSADKAAINTLPAMPLTGTGTRAEKAVQFRGVLVALAGSNEHSLGIFAMGTEAALKSHAKAIEATLASARPAK